VSALTWAGGRRSRSGLASNAACASTHIAAAGQLDALGTHLHAQDNWRTDELSRLVLCEPAARAEPSEGPLAAAAEKRAFADRWARTSRLAWSLMHEEGASSTAAGALGV
jgi:hypothetical protein